MAWPVENVAVCALGLAMAFAGLPSIVAPTRARPSAFKVIASTGLATCTVTLTRPLNVSLDASGVRLRS